ncbi:MAG TPA: 50S ribosomal protein L24, partial [Bacteroidetes bacterium]|nr:50S ribosomal protein L24 [Bacteroidota bacterium]HEX04300.1 50S ribosomal protein L24 [Bacteroidota bacterium]
VRRGDDVLVIAGNDRGKRGKVLKVFPGEGRIIVEGVRFIKRHTRPNPKMPQGGILEHEGKINVSNVKVIDPKSGKPTRIGRKVIQELDGKIRRVRVAKVSGETIG